MRRRSYAIWWTEGDGRRHAGKLEVNRVAKWDGKKWSRVGEGLDRGVRDMVVADDGLWLVGEFEHAGSKPSHHVAKWAP